MITHYESHNICIIYFQNFVALMMEFSSKYDVEVETIKTNIYEEIIHGQWMNLSSFFEKVQNMIQQQDNDIQQDFLENITRKPNASSSGVKTLIEYIYTTNILYINF